RDAGFEVFVIGATRKSSEATAAWERDDGFDIRIMQVLEARVPRRRRRAMQRLVRAQVWREGIASRLHKLEERARSRRLPPLDRLRYRVLARGENRARNRATRAKAALKQVEASTRAETTPDPADPFFLGQYDAAWWPLVRGLRPDVVHAHDRR